MVTDTPVFESTDTTTSTTRSNDVDPNVGNEDTAFSRALARAMPTGVYRRVLVERSGRRIAYSGLTGTLWHYLTLDVERVRSGYRASSSEPG